MRDRPTISAALAALVAVLVAGCGGSSSGPASNGVAARTPNQIVAAATRAIDGVTAVRVSGAVADGSSSNITLDLNLVSGKGATGSISENGLSFKLITVDNVAYINGTPSFWKGFGGAAVERELQGKWLKAPADHGDFASFASLTNLHKLIAGLLSGHGALTKGAATMIGGQKAIALRDDSRHGTLYVATTGTPYPLRISNSGARGGSLDFGDFDKAVSLTPPATSIDISTIDRK